MTQSRQIQTISKEQKIDTQEASSGSTGYITRLVNSNTKTDDRDETLNDKLKEFGLKYPEILMRAIQIMYNGFDSQNEPQNSSGAASNITDERANTDEPAPRKRLYMP